MKKVHKLSVTQIRVFPVDMLGLEFFRISGANDRIRERYSFASPTASQPTFPFAIPAEVAMQFVSGQYEQDGERIVIERLTIEDRRILFTIEGSSASANSFYADLKELLEQLDTRKDRPDYEPLVTADETTSVVQLDIPFNALLSKPLMKLQKEMEKAAQFPGASVNLFPTAIKFSVRYLATPPELARKKVVLSDKEIAIEVRAKTDPNEQIYFIKSPFSSDIHLRLVNELEDSLLSQK